MQDKPEVAKEKNISNINIVLVVVLFLVLFALLCSYGYARYVTSQNGSSAAFTSKIICDIEIQPSENNENIINPYCSIKVKNYNEQDEVSEVAVSFKVQITPKNEFEIPPYYWQDSNGVIVAESADLQGSFELGVKEDKEYTIVFMNTGEEDITRMVDFNLVAIQGQ